MYVKSETLEKIYIPTGGYTQFEYEPHLVNSMVNGQTLETPLTKNPGGLRIKKIINYSNKGEYLSAKRYYYTDKFKTTNREGISSGVLSFKPQYLWSVNLNNFYNTSRPCNTFKLFTSECGLAYYNHSSGVEYNSVIECDESQDGRILGYTKFNFAGYYRYANLSSYDIPIGNTINDRCNGFITPRTPYSSNLKMRQVQNSVEVYNDIDSILKTASYSYIKASEKKVRNSNIWISPRWAGVDISRSVAFGGTYENYYYSYLLRTLDEAEHLENGIVKTRIIYTYNDDNLLASEEKIFSGRGVPNNIIPEDITKTYTYTGDLFRSVEGTNYDELAIMGIDYYTMKTKRMNTYPVEITISKNQGGSIIAGDIYDYSLIRGQYIFMTKHYILRTSKSLVEYMEYKPVELSSGLKIDKSYSLEVQYGYSTRYNKPTYVSTNKKKTTYYWAHNGEYPILVVEGGSFLQNPQIMQTIADYDNEKDYKRVLEPIIKNIKQTQQSYEKFVVTQYNYKHLVGMTSVTSPLGKTTYYNYDPFGRLIEVFTYKNEIVSPENKQMIQSHQYNYQNK